MNEIDQIIVVFNGLISTFRLIPPTLLARDIGSVIRSRCLFVTSTNYEIFVVCTL